MLRIHALGRLYVRGSRGLLTGDAADPRRLAILALLAVKGESGLAADTLTALFWPGADAPQSRVFLERAIGLLEQDLGVQAMHRHEDRLRLDRALISSDVSEYEAALAEGNPELAESRYGGPFLDGFYVPAAPEFARWVDTERARLAERHIEVLEQLARRSTDRGDDHGAVQWWRKLAARDPLNARITLELMRSLERVGDRANALRQARIYEVLVAQQLDLAQDRQVTSLAAELRLAG